MRVVMLAPLVGHRGVEQPIVAQGRDQVRLVELEPHNNAAVTLPRTPRTGVTATPRPRTGTGTFSDDFKVGEAHLWLPDRTPR